MRAPNKNAGRNDEERDQPSLAGRASLERSSSSVSFQFGGNLRTAKSKILSILLCAIAMSGAGCASVGGRGDSRFYPGVYPGVQNHVYYFAHPEENDMPSLWWLGVIDLPFSAALDTVLLPWDLPYWAIRRSSSTNEVYR